MPVTSFVGRNPPRFVFPEQFGRRAPPRLVLEIDIGGRLPVVIAHDEAGGLLFHRPLWWEAALTHGMTAERRACNNNYDRRRHKKEPRADWMLGVLLG